jgi:nucleoside-diphosphate-sugar epimerase
MKIKALITGASGFTGVHLSALLKQEGVAVFPLSCDITDHGALKQFVSDIQPDWVIHLAAKSFVADEDALGFYHVNVVGTENLLSVLAALPKKPSRILIASSANVYGTPNVTCINETVPPEPINHYACSKLAMEHMVRTWFDKLPIVITRPFNYTGPGQDERFIIPKMIAHYVKRAPTIALGNLGVSRDFSDVADVVSSYLALLKSTAQSVTVNVCRGVPTSLNEIIAILNQLAGYEMDVQVNAAFIRANEIPLLCGDNQLLRTLTHQVPATSIQHTLQRMYSM